MGPSDASTRWRLGALRYTRTRVISPDKWQSGKQLRPGTSTRHAYSSVPWPPANTPKQPGGFEPRHLVWYPYPKDGERPSKDTFDDLTALLRAARAGDTILIRHDGLLQIRTTVEVERPRGSTGDFKLSFKPFSGSKPILTGDADGTKLDQTLFRLLSGEVSFEGVQFLLKPSRPRNPQTGAAVAVVGGKTCSFTNCVFTLAEEDEAKAAGLVSDPDKVIAMDTRQPTPDVNSTAASSGQDRPT